MTNNELEEKEKFHWKRLALLTCLKMLQITKQLDFAEQENVEYGDVVHVY